MSTLEIYPAPADLLQPRIELEVRSPGGDWRAVPVMFASSMSNQPHANGGAEGWVLLSIDGPLECRARIPDEVLHAAIRPSLRDPVAFTCEDRELRFSVAGPRHLVLEFNHAPPTGRPWPRYTLYVLMDSPDPTPPHPADCKVLSPGHHRSEDFNPGDKAVLYLEPGVHTVEGQLVHLHSDKTLYLAGGAHLRSYICGESVDRASLRGRGVIDGTKVRLKSIEWRDDGDAGFVFFRRGCGNLIDGPTIFDSPFWNIVTFGTEDTVIRNHKAITWRLNNDGIQPRSCNRLVVEKCFLKCADDCIAVKTRRTAGMISRDLVFRDLICWNDIPGNALEIGHTSQADRLERVRFEHIDVVHSEENHTLSITVIDHCEVRDVVYHDIRVEGVRNTDIKFKISTSRYSTDENRGHIRGVTVRGYQTAASFTGGEIAGFDDQHLVEDVCFSEISEHVAQPQQARRLTGLEELHLKLSHCGHIGVDSNSPVVPARSTTG